MRVAIPEEEKFTACIFFSRMNHEHAMYKLLINGVDFHLRLIKGREGFSIMGVTHYVAEEKSGKILASVRITCNRKKITRK